MGTVDSCVSRLKDKMGRILQPVAVSNHGREQGTTPLRRLKRQGTRTRSLEPEPGSRQSCVHFLYEDPQMSPF